MYLVSLNLYLSVLLIMKNFPVCKELIVIKIKYLVTQDFSAYGCLVTKYSVISEHLLFDQTLQNKYFHSYYHNRTSFIPLYIQNIIQGLSQAMLYQL